MSTTAYNAIANLKLYTVAIPSNQLVMEKNSTDSYLTAECTVAHQIQTTKWYSYHTAGRLTSYPAVRKLPFRWTVAKLVIETVPTQLLVQPCEVEITLAGNTI